MERKNENVIHYVYETTNKVNGMKYIGKHSSRKGIFKDSYYGSGVLISKALSKYGRKNFDRKLLGVYETAEQALDAEKKLIENVKAYTNPNYYNLCEGGQRGGIRQYVPSVDTGIEPIIYNPQLFINKLESDFCKEKGNMYFKLRYYIRFLIHQNKSYDYIKSRCLHLSKNYFKNTKINQSDIFDEIYNKELKQRNNYDDYYFQKRGADFYVEELDMIFNLFDEKATIDGNEYTLYTIRKCAIGVLILYKYLNCGENKYVDLNIREISKLSGINIPYKDVCVLIKYLCTNNYIDINNNTFKVVYCMDKGKLLYHVKLLDGNTHLIYNMYTHIQSKKSIILDCNECGCLITNNKQGTKKYCKDCAKYKKKGIRTCICIDCGKHFTISVYSTKTVRCKECQNYKDRERKREWKRKHKNNTSSSKECVI